MAAFALKSAGMKTVAAPRPATIRDVARQADVSVASASRAMNGLGNVTEATRLRVVGAAKALKYVPHSAARSLSTRRTDTVGVLLPDLYGEFFSEIIRGIALEARGRGLHLLLSNSHGDAAEAAAAIRSMRGRVDGLLVMSPHVDADLLADNLFDGLPIVLMNTPVEGAGHCAIRVDNHGGAYAMVEHLLKTGRRRIAHIAGPEANFESQERRRGYADALGALAPGATPVVLAGDFSEDSGHRAARRLVAMAPRPDAVFAANDMMAIGCLLGLGEAGLRAPDDIAVGGFDDIPLARLMRPALTTVSARICDLGRRALEGLVQSIETPGGGEPFSKIVRPSLIARESSGSKSRPGAEN